jgi:hypothetical protein
MRENDCRNSLGISFTWTELLSEPPFTLIWLRIVGWEMAVFFGVLFIQAWTLEVVAYHAEFMGFLCERVFNSSGFVKRSTASVSQLEVIAESLEQFRPWSLSA